MLSIFQKVNPLRFLANMWFFQNEPVSVVYFVTNRCNARRSFCFIDFDNEDIFKQELTLNEIKKLTKALCFALLSLLIYLELKKFKIKFYFL